MNPKLYKLLDAITLKTSLRPKTKIKIYKTAFPVSAKGGVVISADFELAWAFRYSKKTRDPLAKATQARKNFPDLLELFDTYDIPITWATVGHLMLEKCNKGDHDWMHRLSYFDKSHKWNYFTGDWFDADPHTDVRKDNAWYAPDLIESILKAKTKHEFGCHTFSHIDFSDKNCSPSVADDEIKACIEAAKPWGIELKSMVFPGGTFGNIDILKKYGFSCYRRNLSEKLAYPYVDTYGLIVTHSSQMVGLSNKSWSVEYHAWRTNQIVKKAIRTGTIAHLWFHPSDPKAVEMFKLILPFITSLKEQNMIWIGKMNDLEKLSYHLN